MQGKLIIITAPSGSGKTTIARHLLAHIPQLRFSVSATTRAIRAGEQNGVDYYFITADDFKQRINADKFIEYQEVYTGVMYGTLKEEIERIWAMDNHVVFDVDVVGAKNLKEMYGPNALLMFIKLNSVEQLEQRLRNRNTETKEQLEMRLEKARREMEYEQYADVVILNDDLATAQQNAMQAVSSFINIEQKN